MTRLQRCTGLIVCACLVWAAPARADAVVRWNEIALDALATAVAAGRPNVATALDVAMVQAAVHDAVQAIEKRFEPYHVELPKSSGSSAAAVAKAAHDVLVTRLPAQAAALDTAYHNYLASHNLSEDDPGVLIGEKAAAGIIALRASDGSYPGGALPFVGGVGPGVWRPTPSYLPGAPPSWSPMAVPWLGAVTPFTLTGPTRFRAEPPPDLTSDRYTTDYNEVKAMGALLNSARTPDQTDLAYFWSENYFALWNRVLRTLANESLHNTGDKARLLAVANLAIADAVITAWDTKRHYGFWRPVTAIQERD